MLTVMQDDFLTTLWTKGVVNIEGLCGVVLRGVTEAQAEDWEPCGPNGINAVEERRKGLCPCS